MVLTKIGIVGRVSLELAAVLVGAADVFPWIVTLDIWFEFTDSEKSLKDTFFKLLPRLVVDS